MDPLKIKRIGIIGLTAVIFLGVKLLAASPEVGTLSFVGSVGGTTHAIAAQGPYAYASEGLVFSVLDISDTANPRVVGRSEFTEQLGSIVVSGNTVYATQYPYGDLLAIDVSNPQRPVVIDTDDAYSYGKLAIDGASLYAVSFGDGLSVFDVSRPHVLQALGFLETAHFPMAVGADGDIVVVGDKPGLWIIDVSDRMAPKAVGGVTISPSDSVLAVEVEGDRVYTEFENYFRIYDISDPTKPIELGSTTVFGGAKRIQLAGDYAYLAAAFGRIATIDISDPSDPQRLSTYEIDDRVLDLALSSGDLFYVDDEASIRALDISDPADPKPLGAYDVMMYPVSIVVAGEYAYVADSREGLLVVDVSDPTLPQPVGVYDSRHGGALDLAYEDGYVYLAADLDDLHIVDVSDPMQPVQVAIFDGAAIPSQVAHQGDYVYTEGYGGIFYVVDVHDPKAPKEVESYALDFGSSIDEIVVSGRYAYIVSVNTGLHILDISDPLNVTEAGAYSDLFGAQDVVLMGDYTLVADNSLVTVLDISIPAQIMKVGEYATGSPFNLAVEGTTAFVGRKGVLEMVDFSDPANPVLLDQVYYWGTGSVGDVFVQAGLVYTAGWQNGMVIHTTHPSPAGNERIYLPLMVSRGD